MICITRILAFHDPQQRRDTASDILLHAAKEIRRRWEPMRTIPGFITPAYNSDMAAANNLFLLSRDVLYEEKAHLII